MRRNAMSKLVQIPGCGPMVCSTYGEIAAVIDRAYAGPANRPLRWRGIAAQLADGLVRGVHPLQEMAEMEKEFRAASAAGPLAQPMQDFGPTPG